MGDSWEDDDYVPVLPTVPGLAAPGILPQKVQWDDEEEVRQ